MSTWRNLLVVAACLFLILHHMPGVLLFLFPRLVRHRRVSGVSGAAPGFDPDLFERMAEELEPLGFERLGAHVELRPLKRRRVVYDFVDRTSSTFASASLEKRQARLELLTPVGDGASDFVLTANYRRPFGEHARGRLVGGLSNAEPDKLVAAHRRRVESTGKQPAAGPFDHDHCIAVAQSFTDGASREIRLTHLNSLIIGCIGLAFLAYAVVAIFRHG